MLTDDDVLIEPVLESLPSRRVKRRSPGADGLWRVSTRGESQLVIGETEALRAALTITSGTARKVYIRFEPGEAPRLYKKSADGP